MPSSRLQPADPAADLQIEGSLSVMAECRERTLTLVDGLDKRVLETVYSPLLSPLVWDLAHIAAFEDLWISRTAGCKPLRPDLMQTYDALETPRPLRGRLDLLDAGRTFEYMRAVRSRTCSLIERLQDADLEIIELIVRHEQQHNETMLQLLQLAHLPCAAVRLPQPSSAVRAGAAAAEPTRFVDVPGGDVGIGARVSDTFAYDNERPRHVVGIKPFQLAQRPASNADWLEFIEHGGYARRELWSTAGWAWQQREHAARPLHWTAEGGHWVLDQVRPLDLDWPVIHISFFEAEAFAAFHAARLPTELEWEAAASANAETGAARRYPWGDEAVSRSRANVDQLSGHPEPDAEIGAGPHSMIGDVWEWTSSPFSGYPGFEAHPYREYSEPFFGDSYRVLRGGSWATRARVITASFRNWDLPQRRQIFAGVRLAKDAQ